MTRQSSDVAEGFHPTTWTTNALPLAHLSTEQQEKYRVLATQLLSNTLRDYDIYSADPRQRRMSRRRWKPVKSRDHMTVYKERYPTASPRASIMDRVSTTFRDNEWREPKLLVATGWLEGTLDDVMYGVASANAQDMLLKATVVDNKLIDGAVLACIDAPCTADPFRFLGIKWFVKGPPKALQGIVQPRDVIVIEATGITTRPNGERIGYQLLHSVDLPQYRDMTPQSKVDATRGHISSCSIFKEIPTGLGSRHSKVDVYVKGYVEAHGKLLDSVALAAASTGFLSSWNSVKCANLKKLMWCFRQLSDARQGRHQSQRSPMSSSTSSLSDCIDTPSRSRPLLLKPTTSCGTCTKRLGKLVNGSIACALCSRTTCSRCRVSRALIKVSPELWLRQENVLICKRCVLQVDHLAAVDVARAEVRVGRFSATTAVQSCHKCPLSFASSDATIDNDAAIATLSAKEEEEDDDPLSGLSPTADQFGDSFQGVGVAKTPPSELSESQEPLVSDHEYREQIWSQMVELRMVAESIYKLTLLTTESLTASPINR